MKMLASDNETSDSYKHLVLVTDGVTYLWEKMLLIRFMLVISTTMVSILFGIVIV